MNSERENFDWIESYLNGTLTEEQQVVFENKLQADPALAEEVELHRTVQELVIDQALLDLKAKMVTEYRPKHRGKDPSGPNRGSTFVIIGLVVLSAVTAGGFYWQKQAQPLAPVLVTTEKTQPLSLPQSAGSHSTPALVAISTVSQAGKHNTKQKEAKKTLTVSNYSSTADSATANSISENKTALLTPLAIEPIGETSTPVNILNKTLSVIPAPTRTPTENLPEEPLRDCANLLVTVKVRVHASCSDFPSGKITYDRSTVAGGEPPYRFSLDNGLSFTQANSFEHLSPGIYYLTVEDKRGCRYTLPESFEVESTVCNTPQEYAFAPEQGETCKFPFAEHRTGTLRIFNRAGVLVYSTAIRNGFPNEWNGQGNQGVVITMGNYRFTFEDVQDQKIGGTITLLK